jgi:hypothetical protein
MDYPPTMANEPSLLPPLSVVEDPFVSAGDPLGTEDMFVAAAARAAAAASPVKVTPSDV